jgi:oligosaccharide repeat unit polymerase
MPVLLQIVDSEQNFVCGSDFKSRGYFFLWTTSTAFLLGLVAFWSEQPWLFPMFFVFAYAVILFALVRTSALWRDVLNPLSLVLALGFIRFLIPGLMFLSGAELPEDAANFFGLMQLSDNEWLSGHVLALIGLVATILGWLLVQTRRNSVAPLKFHISEGTKYAALVGMSVGFMALLAFFLKNASLGAILSGSFRGTTVEVGSGKYFVLAYLLIVGSIFLCCYLLSQNVKWWRALVPVAIAMMAYWPLGGRGRAVMPVMGGLILLWYVNRERKGWSMLSIKPSHFLKVPVAALLVILVFYVGSTYRGNSDPNTLLQSLSITGLSQYLKSAIYMDLGQLHSLAGAIAIGPGVLEGKTFIGSLSWPLSAFLPIPGRSTGIYIIEELVGFPDEHRWGIAATLLGDAYVNFGFHGVIITMGVYGAALKIIYLKFRQGVLHSTVYALAVLTGMQMLWGSIEVWPQTLSMLLFAFAITLAGKTVFNLGEDNPRAEPVQKRDAML